MPFQIGWMTTSCRKKIFHQLCTVDELLLIRLIKFCQLTEFTINGKKNNFPTISCLAGWCHVLSSTEWHIISVLKLSLLVNAPFSSWNHWPRGNKRLTMKTLSKILNTCKINDSIVSFWIIYFPHIFKKWSLIVRVLIEKANRYRTPPNQWAHS